MLPYHLYTYNGVRVELDMVGFGMSLPKESGIYAVFAADRLLYIGRANDLDERSGAGVWNHEKALVMSMAGARFVGYLTVPNTFFRDELEAALIAFNKPPLNDQHNSLARVASEGVQNSLLGPMFS